MKTIPKSGPVRATVTAPPSKSYSVRAILLAAMAEGTTTITNCLDADDTRYAFEALKAGGILVKNLHGSHPHLAHCLRLTVGTPDENAKLLEALASIIGPQNA